MQKKTCGYIYPLLHKHLITVKYELGKHIAASSSSLHIWSRNHLAEKHDLYGKSSHLLFGKCRLLRLLCNSADIDLCLGFDINTNLCSEDPPSKENPYEDIELERTCLGSKCVSPASSSPAPDTPNKVLDFQHQCCI